MEGSELSKGKDRQSNNIIKPIKQTRVRRRGRSDEPFTMEELQIPFLSEDGAMMESERKIAEYLTRCGLIAEPGISDAERASAIRKRREENYHNIASLLDQYRSLRRTYDMFKDDFAEELIGGMLNKSDPEKSLFNMLSQRLELLSVTEERRFQRTFAPQITAGKKIEFAIDALDFGLRMLEGRDKALYDIICATYIDGETKPPVREIMAKLNCASHSSYYQKLEMAKKELTKVVFGFSTNKAELASILVYLRQQLDDDYFPDGY